MYPSEAGQICRCIMGEVSRPWNHKILYSTEACTQITRAAESKCRSIYNHDLCPLSHEEHFEQCCKAFGNGNGITGAVCKYFNS